MVFFHSYPNFTYPRNMSEIAIVSVWLYVLNFSTVMLTMSSTKNNQECQPRHEGVALPKTCRDKFEEPAAKRRSNPGLRNSHSTEPPGSVKSCTVNSASDALLLMLHHFSILVLETVLSQNSPWVNVEVVFIILFHCWIMYAQRFDMAWTSEDWGRI